MPHARDHMLDYWSSEHSSYAQRLLWSLAHLIVPAITRLRVDLRAGTSANLVGSETCRTVKDARKQFSRPAIKGDRKCASLHDTGPLSDFAHS